MSRHSGARPAEPGGGQSWRQEADEAQAKGQLDRAEAIYQAAITSLPTDPEPCNQLGILAVRRKQWTRAEGLFREAVRRDGEFARGWANLGNVLLEQDELGEAGSAFQQALAIDPDLAPAHRGLAALAKRRGDTGQMARELKTADRITRRRLVGSVIGFGQVPVERRTPGPRARAPLPLWVWLVGIGVVLMIILSVRRG